MHPSDFDDVPTDVLMELALRKMRAAVIQHKQYLIVMGIARETSRLALENDVAPTNVEEALVKHLVAAPGRLSDPRIAELPDEMSERVCALTDRLRELPSAAAIELEDWRQLVKDIKQLDADMEPLYDWHEEMRRDLVRMTAETN